MYKLLTKQEQIDNWNDLKVIGFSRAKRILQNPKKNFNTIPRIYVNEAMEKGIAGEAHFLEHISKLRTKSWFYYGILVYAKDDEIPTFQLEYKGYIFNAQPDYLVMRGFDVIAIGEIKTSKFNVDELQKKYWKQLAYYYFIIKNISINVMVERFELVRIDPNNFDDYIIKELNNPTILIQLYKDGEIMVNKLKLIIDEELERIEREEF